MRTVVGVPKEVKESEGRVALTPQGVKALKGLDATVLVQSSAGALAGFSDDSYREAGAQVVLSALPIWRMSDIVLKVKEPIREEYPFLMDFSGKILFAYLHLAGVDPGLTRMLLTHKITAIAYENVKEVQGERQTFPLLAPMSKIAGVQSMLQALSRYPERDHAKLRGVIIGCGNVGEAALQVALISRLGTLAVFESRIERIAELKEKYRGIRNNDGHASLVFFHLDDLLAPIGRAIIESADIVISGPMVPGGNAAPVVLTEAHLSSMKSGAYVADVSIDQGGSTAWTVGRPTAPGETRIMGQQGIHISAVPNIPGSTVPKEATAALTAATLVHVYDLVDDVIRCREGAVLVPPPHVMFRLNAFMRSGLQTFGGEIVNRPVAEKLGMMEKFNATFPY